MPGLFKLIALGSESGASGQNRKWAIPASTIAAGPLAVFILMIWGGGVRRFYIYRDGYKRLFF